MAKPSVSLLPILLLVLVLPAAAGSNAQSRPVEGTVPSAQPAAPSAQPAAPEEATDRNLRAYVELLRSDVRTQKTAIITQMMQFSEADDQAFWPLYREYELEMSKINDERIAMIEEYARSYAQITDATADKLATQALDLEARRNALKGKFYERVKQATSARTAAKFLQVEQQLLLLLDLQVSAALPIIN
jgi:hypothetical protein